jgi:uncharacterized protein YxeA
MSKLMRNEDAFTGLEAAIVLIAFIVVAAVFSYVLMELVDRDPLVIQEERRVRERHDEEERKEEDEHRDKVSLDEAGDRSLLRLAPGLVRPSRLMLRC